MITFLWDWAKWWRRCRCSGSHADIRVRQVHRGAHRGDARVDRVIRGNVPPGWQTIFFVCLAFFMSYVFSAFSPSGLVICRKRSCAPNLEVRVGYLLMLTDRRTRLHLAVFLPAGRIRGKESGGRASTPKIGLTYLSQHSACDRFLHYCLHCATLYPPATGYYGCGAAAGRRSFHLPENGRGILSHLACSTHRCLRFYFAAFYGHVIARGGV